MFVRTGEHNPHLPDNPIAFTELDPGLDPSVAYELLKLRVQHEGRRLFEEEQRAALGAPPDVATLGEVLDRPPEPPWRIQGLLPTEGRMLLTAQRKTGKTVLALNLGKSLIDGRHFLGRFPVRPVGGNVGVVNLEVSARQIARWAERVGLPPDRLVLVNARGRRNPFGTDADRLDLARRLRDHGVEALIVDPFGRAYTGRSQNDAGEVTAWLAGLDRFAAEAGCAEVVLTAHAGWDAERTRGSTALEDWPDAVVTVRRDDEDGARYLDAFGRDVEVPEDRLVFEPDTLTLTLAGTGSRKRARAERAVEAMLEPVLDHVAEHPGCSGDAIRKGVDGRNDVIDRARRLLVERGRLTEAPRPGRGGGKAYHAVDT